MDYTLTAVAGSFTLTGQEVPNAIASISRPPVVMTIRLRRGNQANLPIAKVGEPLVTLDTQRLYIGFEDENHYLELT